jgi:hypothetical protein
VEAESISKMSEMYQSTSHHIPKEWTLHVLCCENLKSHKSGVFSNTAMPSLLGILAKILFHFGNTGTWLMC